LESFSLQHSLRHLCVMHCTVNMRDLKYNSGVFSYSELQLYPRQDMSLRFTRESVATRKVPGQLGKLPGQCSLISGPGPEMEAPLSDVRQAP
jgi:hypothetical protein